MRNKIVTAEEAVALIHDGDAICTSGFVGVGTPDEILLAIERRFLDQGGPRDLTLFFAAGQGDGKERGLNRLGHDGLLKRVIGGHYGLAPKIGRLAVENKIEAWNLPQGVISHLYRDIAAGKPGTITKVGLHTFVDPRLNGGKVNDATTDDIVDLITLNGEQWLFYKARPLNVAIIRGTTADAAGNITMEREALVLDNLAMASAARNCGGLVIAQVERIAARGSLNPRSVIVPGVLVDCIVVAEPENHPQTYATQYSPVFSSEVRAPLEDSEPSPLTIRKVIGRRAALEAPINAVVNLGIGMPEAVADVAREERILDHITLTAEPGVIGGAPAGGLDFGAAANTDALIAQNQQFDFYDGGGLDLAVLGMAECDAAGNVNVSRFGPKLAGCGGFINISQNARKVVFTGSFTAAGLDAVAEDGRLVIRKEGAVKKFRKAVEEITFSGAYAATRAQPVLYVTERCVFALTEDGLALTEVAPGIDIDRDILAQMEFAPIIDAPVEMDAALFRDAPMNLRHLLLAIDLSHRIHYDEARETLFLNFEGMDVRDRESVADIAGSVEAACQKIGKRVAVVVNYDAFRIDDAVADAYAEMVKYLEERYYTNVSRYTTSAFMRMKLGKILTRQVAPHIFESKDEAQDFLSARASDD